MKRLYRFLLRIYPAGFREEYGSELERQFTEEYREGGWRVIPDHGLRKHR